MASTGAGEPIEEDEIQPEFLRVFQLPTDRFQEALPVLPAVIRDTERASEFQPVFPKYRPYAKQRHVKRGFVRMTFGDDFGIATVPGVLGGWTLASGLFRERGANR